MTVSYSAQVSGSGLRTFVRLLLRWKGSIYKLMYKEMLVFWALYFILNLTYRFALNANQKVQFENLCIFFGQYSSYVPLTFILGFYVNMVVARWWKIFQSLIWPDNIVLSILVYIPGVDYQSRLIRRSLVRWLALSNVLMLRSTSAAVRKRFPTMNHLKDAGFITQDELTEFDSYTYPSHTYWVPLRWCHELMSRCRLEKRIANDRFLLELVELVIQYRKSIATTLDYDWISVPLVYTQVVTLAVYSFFAAALLSRQVLDHSVIGHESDFYFPIFTTTQFIFYMGWLKVAETLINPLGEDDDDFEVNWMIDRNLKYSYLVVDEMSGRLPNLCQDIHWNQTEFDIPYTEASLGVKDEAPVGSASGIVLTEDEAKIASPIPSAAVSMASLGQTSLMDKLSRSYLRLRSTSSHAGEAESGHMANDHVTTDMIIEKLGTIEEIGEYNTIQNAIDRDYPPIGQIDFGNESDTSKTASPITKESRFSVEPSPAVSTNHISINEEDSSKPTTPLLAHLTDAFEEPNEKE